MFKRHKMHRVIASKVFIESFNQLTAAVVEII